MFRPVNHLKQPKITKSTKPNNYYLSQGYTTWPEDWVGKPGVSKMHGCFNGIGLWFIEGVAGVRVHVSENPPITVRAGVDAGDITWAKGRRAAPYGQVASSWQLGGGSDGFHHNVTVPGNAKAKVAIPASSASEITEGGRPLAEAKGVTVVGDEIVNQVHYVVLTVMSGEYKFSSSWTRSEVVLV